MGRKAYPKELPLAIEYLLLENTDESSGRRMSVSEIRKQLQNFDIEVDGDTIRKTIDAMNRWYETIQSMHGQGDGDDSVSRCLRERYSIWQEVPGEKKVLYSIDRGGYDSSDIEHLVRVLQGNFDETAPNMVRYLLSQLDRGAREKIMSAVEAESAQSDSETAALEATLVKYDRLREAISHRRYMGIQSAASSPMKTYLPLCVWFDGDHYYLAAKRANAQFFKKRKQKGNDAKRKVPSPEYFRIDRIFALENVTKEGTFSKDAADDPMTYANDKGFRDMSDECRKLMSTGVDGIFSGGIVEVSILCHKQKAATYFRAAFNGWEEHTMADSSKPRFTVKASRDGMKHWARKWCDAVEVLSPKDLRDEIIDELKQNVYSGSDNGGGSK